MTEEELSRALAELRGARSWQPPCTETDIAKFEARHGIRLPHDYSRFLLEVGNGSTDDTVFSLGRTSYPDAGPLTDVGDLAKPCPLSVYADYWNEPEEDLVDQGDDDDDEPTDHDDEQMEEAAERWQDEMWPLDGIVPIAYLGCTLYQYLVVTGPERGHVWEFEGGSHHPMWGPFCPTPNRLRRSLTFVEWLCLHLKRAELVPGSDETAGTT